MKRFLTLNFLFRRQTEVRGIVASGDAAECIQVPVKCTKPNVHGCQHATDLSGADEKIQPVPGNADRYNSFGTSWANQGTASVVDWLHAPQSYACMFMRLFHTGLIMHQPANGKPAVGICSCPER